MKLVIIRPQDVDRVWREGAHRLAEACKWADREVTPDQLKMMLMRNERTLIAMQADDGSLKAYAAIQSQNLPNVRVLHIYSIYAPGVTGAECFEQLLALARSDGCAEIRGAVRDSMLRLLQMRFKAQKVYNIASIPV